MAKRGFISFSDLGSPKSFVKEENSNSSNKIISIPVYNGNNSELDVLCKKILKKDAITRNKAILETIQLFEVSI